MSDFNDASETGKTEGLPPYQNSPVTPIIPVTPTDDGASSVTGQDSQPDTPVNDSKSANKNAIIERPTYRCYERKTDQYKSGVWLHGLNNKGDPYDSYVCSPLHVDAIASDGMNNFGRLLRFRNSNGKWREWCMPMSMLKGYGEELRGELLSMGAEIDPDGHRSLNRYIQSMHPRRTVTAATRTGWHDDELFILPEYNIGSGDALFQSEHANTEIFKTDGTLDDWVDQVAKYASGNPLLIIALGAAFAGPLLHHLSKQGGGLHFHGDSSTGKSTLLEACASVWGLPFEFVRTWRATGNGLEGVAAMRSDTIVILDEIAEVNANEVGNIIYCLANGSGKTRSDRSGNARQPKRWRVMIVSSGETTIACHMAEARKNVRAGQEIRLLDIPAAREYGAWDALHGHEDGRAFSDHLKRATAQHYGHAGPEFIRRLIESNLIPQLPKLLAEKLSHFKSAGGQEGRSAERLAICALGAWCANYFGLLPLKDGEEIDAAVAAFADWKKQRGSGQSESRKIVEALSDYVFRYGDSMFTNILYEGDVIDRAGWYSDSEGERIWIMPSKAIERACPGYQAERIGKALAEFGWLGKHDPDRLTGRSKPKNGKLQRFYHFKVQEFT